MGQAGFHWLLYLQAGEGLWLQPSCHPLAQQGLVPSSALGSTEQQAAQSCEPALHYGKVGAAQTQTPLGGGVGGRWQVAHP